MFQCFTTIYYYLVFIFMKVTHKGIHIHGIEEQMCLCANQIGSCLPLHCVRIHIEVYSSMEVELPCRIRLVALIS